MDKLNPLENKSLRNRLKEVFILCLAITMAAVFSVVLMDILIYPLAVFSTKNKKIFNFIIKDSVWILLIASIILYVARKIYRLKMNGVSHYKILKITWQRISILIISFIIILSVVFSVAAIIYIMFNYNYYLLYKLSN